MTIVQSLCLTNQAQQSVYASARVCVYVCIRVYVHTLGWHNCVPVCVCVFESVCVCVFKRNNNSNSNSYIYQIKI